MVFEQVRVGGDRNFAYIVGDESTRQSVVIDPAFSPEKVVARCKELGLEIKYLVNTHGHYDHTGGNDEVTRTTGAEVVGHPLTRPDVAVKDGEEIVMGNLTLRFIYTPGHTSDSICLLADGKLMTGDTLFVGKVGGTGFGEDVRNEYDSLHEKLMTLPDDVEVYPGHDYGTAPISTIGHERATNPFLLRETFEDFVDLKRNWAEYKREHGID